MSHPASWQKGNPFLDTHVLSPPAGSIQKRISIPAAHDHIRAAMPCSSAPRALACTAAALVRPLSPPHLRRVQVGRDGRGDMVLFADHYHCNGGRLTPALVR